MGIYILLPVIAGMGAVAGLAVMAVLVGRILLKRGPKLFCYLLWSVVLFRLLCPVSVPSMFSALRLFGLGRMEFIPTEPTAFPALLQLQKALCHRMAVDAYQENSVKADGTPAEGQDPSGNVDAAFPAWGYTDSRASGGAYDLWLAWQGRFDSIHSPAAREMPAAQEALSRILLPAPPALLLEDGDFEDVLAKGVAAAWGREGSGADGGAAGFPARADKDAQDFPAKETGVPVWLAIATWVWLSGIALMLLYSLVSLLLLRRRLAFAVRVEGNIYQSDYIDSPFVFGLFSPRIYLPSALCGKEQKYILLHEQTHIRRGDYIFRLLAFVALVLHWFNPLVWLAFYLSGKDMEMACDEAVMKRMKEDIRAEYSASLLGLAAGRHFVLGTYLAFGAGDVKGRIKNVMRYKKPTMFWVVFAVVLVSGTVCTFGSDPKAQEEAGHPGSLAGATLAGVEIDRDVEEAKTGQTVADVDVDAKTGGVLGEADDGRAVLTVYSLADSALAQELVQGFAARHPELTVLHETGEEGLSVTEQADALTARLLAGTGPDVLFLDGLPAQSYRADGLLTDMAGILAPLQEGLQQNILSAYTEKGQVFMLPVRYFVPFALTGGQGAKVMESLHSLAVYAGGASSDKKVGLDGYSWADLLELVYYNYAPGFLREDGTVAKDDIENFLLYTKWLGDSGPVEGEVATHRYLEEKFAAAELTKEDAQLLFMPLCGMDDLYAYSAKVGEMVRQGRKMQQVGGVFFPEGLVGINAWSTKKESAALFVQAVFSEEMQGEYAGSGFCVNAEVFQENFADWVTAWEAEDGDAVWGRGDGNGTVSFTPDIKGLAGQMENALCRVHIGRSVDAAVLHVLTEEAMGYFSGEITLDECVEAVVGRIW